MSNAASNPQHTAAYATPRQAQSDRNKSGSSGGETARPAVDVAGSRGQAATEHFVTTPAKDILSRMQQYAKEKPDVAVCWCFALGVIVGWKLRS